MLIRRTTSLANGATLSPNNVWAGSAYEYLPGPAFVAIALNSLTTQALAGLLSIFTIGGFTICEEYTVPNQDPAIYGRNVPEVQNSFMLTGGGGQNARIVSTLRNPTAGTIAYDGTAIITPGRGGRR